MKYATIIVFLFSCLLVAGEPSTPLWQQRVGVGDGSVAANGKQLFAVGLFAPDGKSAVPPRQKSPNCAEVLISLDAETGAEQWRRIIESGPVKKGKAWEYEHCTPVVRNDRVYVRGCWGTLACYEAGNGEPVWHRAPASMDAIVMDFGYEASAVLGDHHLFSVVCSTGKGRKARLLAVSLADGKDVWSRDLETGSHAKWAPPALGTFKGKTTLVMFCQNLVLGLNPNDGSEYWRFDLLKDAELPNGPEASTPGTPGHTHEDSNSPAIIGDIVTGEFRRFAKKAGNITVSDYFGLRITPDGPKLLWTSRDFVNSWDTQQVHDGRIYGIARRPAGKFGATVAKYHYRANDGKAALECRDPASGKVIWSVSSLTPANEPFAGAAFSIAGHWVLTHDENQFAIGRLTPSGYTHVSSIPIKGKAGEPVLADGRIYLRMAEGTLYCYKPPSEK